MESATFDQVLALASARKVIVSDLGYEKAEKENILISELVAGLDTAEVIEDYPDYWKGPCVLTLQADRLGKPVHVLWGLARDSAEPAVLITCYRPNSKLWSDDFRKRKRE